MSADDAPAETGVVVIPERDDIETEWGTRVVSVGLCFDFDPAVVVDSMTRAFLAHTRQAIMTGQRPDGRGPQRRIGRRALSDPDRESANRGFNTGELADGLRRTKIKVSKGAASSRVFPPTSRTVYVATEAERGVNLLSADGAAGEVAAAAGRDAIDVILEGRRLVAKSTGEVDAAEASK